MIYDGKIKGKYVYLKSAAVEDAEFTLLLRQNDDLTKFIPRLDISIEQQEKWIRSQREKPGDFFFVAWNKEDRPIGTVSIYNVAGDVSESGRLALIGNALENTEASMLLFQFAFHILGLKMVTGYIIEGNKRAERFNRQFGCQIGGVEKSGGGYMVRRTLITYESFYEAEKKLHKLLYRN